MHVRVVIATGRRVAEFWTLFTLNASPLYTSIVQLQTMVAFAIMVAALLFTSNAFFEESIHCVDRASLEPVLGDHLAVCVMYARAAGHDPENGPVNQLYTWGHVYLWAVAGLLLIPNLMVLCLTPSSLKLIFLDNEGEVRTRESIANNLKQGIGKFDLIYWWAILMDLMSLICNVLCFVMIDMLLLNGMVPDILRGFPWPRDTQAFTDTISLAFPSFLQCNIDPDAHLVGQKGKYYGCFHKTATLYAFAFMLVGVLVLLASLLNLLHLLYVVTYLPTARGRRHLLTSGNKFGLEVGFESRLSLGDLLVLEMSKHYIDAWRYASIFAHLMNHAKDSGEEAADEGDLTHAEEGGSPESSY